MSQNFTNFTNYHNKIRHVDAHASLNDGVVVQTVSNDLEKHLEEPVAEPEPDPEPEPEQETVSEIQEEKSALVLEEPATKDAQKSSSPAPTDIAQTVQEDLRTFSWASVTSKNLPPSGAIPVTGIPPRVVTQVPASQPCPESKPESQIPPQRPQRDQRV
ncbi:Ras GTPase-activating protein-binding protein 1 [Sciurus carolinensis]|uniref:Ras GTPase-activating protein-binding protein 1 n=1 Tax=Sciurus carolinensis TaxID=30640 RepID=A0AA41MDR7_SCICA|nr:Ras GTPase-activating protein-binding protein 1 [Sciurus carolinensis]